jgi:endonuclease/exonuclease/phosphatase family metal-dependent hydrolase
MQLDQIETGSFATHESLPILSETLRVVSWNINRGSCFDLILAFLASMDADLILLQECDLNARRSGFRNVARELAQRLKMKYIFGTEFVELSQGNGKLAALHGQATLSRLELNNPRILRFRNQTNFWKPRWFLPSIGPLQRRLGGRMALVAEIVVNERTVAIYNLHLESRNSEDLRCRQLCELLGDAQKYGADIPVILGGDFNFDVTQGKAVAAIEGMKFQNPFATRVTQTTTRQVSRQPRGIDWILIRSALSLEDPRVYTSAPGSDHFPLSLRLRFC